MIARAIARALSEHVAADFAWGYRQATELLTSRCPASWVAAIIDIVLPDGDGLALASSIHARTPQLPVLVISGYLDGERVNGALAAGAHVGAKPVDVAALRAFVARAVRTSRSTRIHAAVARLAAAEGLSPREAELLELAISTPRAELARRAHIGENTVKTHVRHMLQKLGGVSLDDAIRRVLSDALEPR